MSNINVWRSTNVSTGSEDEVQVPILSTGDADIKRYTDGEELMAARQLIEMLDDLENGEVLVINRELF